MFLDIIMADLETEVWERLELVTDPELDEPITDMGFVETVKVSSSNKVEVEFRLPTYWCSPNFAFLMAFGIRREVASLPWVRGVTVSLRDHCFGDEVNEGVNSGRAFSEVFALYCDGADLGEVTAKFDAKAFDRRQEVMLLALQERGLPAEDIVTMTLGTFDRIAFAGGEEERQKPRYRALLMSRGLAQGPDDPAFPTWEGQSIGPMDLKAHLARLRGIRINMEFNGALCKGLASSRYKEVEIGPEGPTLVDFIAGRVPTKGRGASAG
ncbi:iron-sulfur cluster assembly protein [Tropicimonas isoalkanivorans]|uniref:Metal-sulfur cluster biosynthetic enzyme n=1 Tax=Tropicimonas isoalkanivorans TaxID=441112 RepID=A0A1I1QDC6_9RHOB|nr:iron-sulfur cluster assembly protein [Tropicimonas isoalkanivorans]SFD20079.1 Metal-sulfur cluster biosynthetic enzyme [Tropicimonas isoalkanivorans]